MAYNTLVTTSDVISTVKPIINLATTNILDNITLKFRVALKNTTGSAVTVAADELLNACPRIILMSDGNVSHINTSAYQLALLNAFRKTKSVSPFKRIGSTTINANTSVTKEFYLKINEGDILAVTKKSLTLEVGFNETVKTGVVIESASVTPTYSQGVIEDKQADLIAKYGASGELAAEPKIYVMEVDVPANTTLTPAISLQYGCLIRRAVLTFHSVTGGIVNPTPDVCPDAIGLISTNPTRNELINVDAATFRENQDDDYFIDDQAGRPAGAFLFDFANTLAADGMGLKGWRLGVDDFRLGVKTSVPCRMKVIFIEHVVNTSSFDKGYMPILESPLGF